MRSLVGDSMRSTSYPEPQKRSTSFPSLFGTSACPSDNFAVVQTIADRIQWVLDNRKRPDGRPWKAKPLSLEAGLGGPHVGMIARGDVTNVKTETIYAIARAALRLAEIPHARADAVALARLLEGPAVARCGRLPRGEPEKGGAGRKNDIPKGK